MRQLILDTETTGLYPERGDRIIEFAALEVVNRSLTGKKLHLYINPERSIDKAATAIHGITDDHLKDKPVWSEVVGTIIDFIRDAELIIHNAKFDVGFLDYQFALSNYGTTQSIVSGVIDTLVMARQKYPGGKNSLDALCDRFNIDRADRGYHGAEIDCHLLMQVYLALTREQISLLLDESANKHSLKAFEKLDTTKYNLKILQASDAELVLHESYLDGIHKSSKGNCLWMNLGLDALDNDTGETNGK